jgi:hypothetical protein
LPTLDRVSPMTVLVATGTTLDMVITMLANSTAA